MRCNKSMKKNKIHISHKIKVSCEKVWNYAYIFYFTKSGRTPT